MPELTINGQRCDVDLSDISIDKLCSLQAAIQKEIEASKKLSTTSEELKQASDSAMKALKDELKKNKPDFIEIQENGEFKSEDGIVISVMPDTPPQVCLSISGLSWLKCESFLTVYLYVVDHKRGEQKHGIMKYISISHHPKILLLNKGPLTKVSYNPDTETLKLFPVNSSRKKISKSRLEGLVQGIYGYLKDVKSERDTMKLSILLSNDVEAHSQEVSEKKSERK